MSLTCQLRALKPSSVALLHRSAWLIRSFASGSQQEIFEDEDKERLVSLLTVKVRGADEAVLDSYTQFAQRAAKVLQLDTSGKIVLPMHVEKRTLLKSPHINKKHRVQYELRTHARMFQLRELTGDTADIYLEYIQRNIPEGVSMSVEQTQLEHLPSFLQQKL